MSYAIETHRREGYLLFIVSGSLESAEDLTAFSNAVEAGAREGDCTHVLLDMRRLVRKVDQHDCVTYADKRSAENPHLWLKIAAVYSPEDAITFQWVETIYQNRSINYKIFISVNEAEQWLRASDSGRQREHTKSMRYHFTVEDGFLHVSAEGSMYSVDEVLQHVGILHKRRVEAGLSKVLVNETKCHMHMNFDAVNEVAQALDALNWTDPRVAIVSSTINHLLFDHMFNSNVRIKVFTDEDEARQWLVKE